MKPRPFGARLLAFLACTLSLAPTALAKDLMNPLDGGVTVSPDAATVVFLRGPGGEGPPRIIDEGGRVLGAPKAESWFSVTMPPGEHSFLVFRGYGPFLTARLAPGRVYYVEVVPLVFTSWPNYAQTWVLRALAPERPDWSELPRRLGECRHLEPDAEAIASFSAKKKENIDYFLEYVRSYTLSPEDGVAVPVVPEVVPSESSE